MTGKCVSEWSAGNRWSLDRLSLRDERSFSVSTTVQIFDIIEWE